MAVIPPPRFLLAGRAGLNLTVAERTLSSELSLWLTFLQSILAHPWVPCRLPKKKLARFNPRKKPSASVCRQSRPLRRPSNCRRCHPADRQGLPLRHRHWCRLRPLPPHCVHLPRPPRSRSPGHQRLLRHPPPLPAARLLLRLPLQVSARLTGFSLLPPRSLPWQPSAPRSGC